MIIPFQLPKMYEPRSGRTKTFIFITLDDHLVRKKLKVCIAAKEDKPRINIFDDETFTVGETPIVYSSSTNDEGEIEWTNEFQFKNVHVEYGDNEEETSDDT